MSEDSDDQFRKDLGEMLSEIRIALPGVQFLLAFLLTVPFDNRFAQLSTAQRSVFGVSLIGAAFACVFLVTPSVYHRLHWRRAVRDKEKMLRIFNGLAITGSAFLCVSINTALYVVIDFVYGKRVSVPVLCTLSALSLWLWYGLALVRRVRERA